MLLLSLLTLGLPSQYPVFFADGDGVRLLAPFAKPLSIAWQDASHSGVSKNLKRLRADGTQEPVERGYVGIHSVLSYKRFQAVMSQKTGLPVNQLSSVFVCRRTVRLPRICLPPRRALRLE
jgi:hypothetical protein